MGQILRYGFMVATLVFASSANALSAADRCESGKLAVAGKYELCRLKAESRAVKKNASPDYSKCDEKYSSKWAVYDGGDCPSTGDEAVIKSFIAQHTDDLAVALGGGGLPICTTNLCGNGTIDGSEQCDQLATNGATCVTEGFAGGTIKCDSGCSFDTSACWLARFVDNGDSTVTDNQTGLMWEQKDDLGGIHDKDNEYPWSLGPPWGMTGTAFTTFLGTLNYSASDDATTISGCFAGHCDWRLPSIAELRGILLAPYPCGTHPCIDPVFGPVHPTKGYWSSTSSASEPSVVWWVHFFDGKSEGGGLKRDIAAPCRAVRGGP